MSEDLVEFISSVLSLLVLSALVVHLLKFFKTSLGFLDFVLFNERSEGPFYYSDFIVGLFIFVQVGCHQLLFYVLLVEVDAHFEVVFDLKPDSFENFVVFLLLFDQIVLQKDVFPRHPVFFLKLEHSSQQILDPLVPVGVNRET